MTRELLESYRSKQGEIIELKDRLLRLGKGESMIDSDTILDYRKGYPIPQAVVGVDEKKVERMKARYHTRISILEKECQEVEDFIEDISDSMIRRIFRMYYLEGLPQKDIALNVHMDRSGISKKINEYLNILQNMH